MSYGIRNISEAAEGYEIVRCFNCWTYYYDEIIDERDNNSLAFIWDEAEDGFFKGCPQCQTDEYLADIEGDYLAEVKAEELVELSSCNTNSQ